MTDAARTEHAVRDNPALLAHYRHRFREIPDLIVPRVAAGIDDEKRSSAGEIAFDSPFDRAGHVAPRELIFEKT